jgi:hypothetical protein
MLLGAAAVVLLAGAVPLLLGWLAASWLKRMRGLSRLPQEPLMFGVIFAVTFATNAFFIWTSKN